MAIHDLIIRIGAQVSPGFQAGIKRAFSGIESLMGGMAGGALLGAPAGLLGLGSSRLKEMGQIQDLAESLGASTVYLGQLQRVAAVSGVTMDTVAAAMGRLSAAAVDAPEKFARLGISVWGVNGEVKNSEQLMKETMNALAGMGNATERAAAAKRIFGKSFVELLPVLRNYNEEMSKGSRVTEEAAQKADEYDKNLNRIWANVKDRAAITFGGALSTAAEMGAALTSLPEAPKGRRLSADQMQMEIGMNRLNNDITPSESIVMELIKKSKEASRSQDVMVARLVDQMGGL